MVSVIDYTEDFSEHVGIDFVIAQGSGRNFISIVKLETPIKRLDGKKASYELGYRYLSTDCENSKDQAWACVLGSEQTFWQAKEIKKLLADMKKGDVNVFDYFNIM